MLSRRRPGAPVPHLLLALLLASVSLPSCAEVQNAPESEGSVAFSAGLGQRLHATNAVEPGPPLARLGIVTPVADHGWSSAWIAKDSKQSAAGQGAQAGFMAGASLVQMAPLALTFWPAAVGIAAGMTAMGVVGAQLDTEETRRLAPDRAAIAEATAKLHPDQVLRDAFCQRLARRTGRPVVPVLLQDANIAGSDPVAEARSTGLDGLADVQIESMGLAAGEDSATFGVFAQVRLRIMDAQGRLRYERTVKYGPGHTVPELPRPQFHSLEFLAMERAFAYTQATKDTIRWIGLLLAEDPALPVK